MQIFKNGGIKEQLNPTLHKVVIQEKSSEIAKVMTLLNMCNKNIRRNISV